MPDWQIELEQIRKEVQELKSMENKVRSRLQLAFVLLHDTVLHKLCELMFRLSNVLPQYEFAWADFNT